MLHVVGNVCVDLSFRLLSFPRPGETLNADRYDAGLGGKGANQAVAAARTGAPVRFRAAVGADAEAALIRRLLAPDLELDGLAVIDAPTDRSMILVDAAGENMIVSGVDCARRFDPLAGGATAGFAAGDLLLVQGNLRPDVTAALIAAAAEAGARTVLNPSPLAPGLPAVADLVIANAGEASALSGVVDPAAAAAALLSAGAGAVIVTLGAGGCLVAEGSGPALHLSAPRVEAVDTAGAGDVFAGVVAGLLALGRPLVAAARMATAAAAIAVTRPGTHAAIPGRDELARLWLHNTDGS